jgi:hypothetical protein
VSSEAALEEIVRGKRALTEGFLNLHSNGCIHVWEQRSFWIRLLLFLVPEDQLESSKWGAVKE